MTIVIIDYGVGNLGSIANMLKKIGAEAVISEDIAVINRADKIILPGVGAFDNGIRNLTERNMLPVLNSKVLKDHTPTLGLCLGMELMTKGSEEGQLPGLGWFEANTIRFRIEDMTEKVRIPHMGWNTLEVQKATDPLFADLSPEHRFYFAHSYHVVCDASQDVMATTYYGYPFASVISKGHIRGAQFHPEKSHTFGMQLLRAFAEHC